MATVVLLHGYGRTPASMQLLAWRLRQYGYKVAAPRFGFERRMAAILDTLVPEVERLAEEGGGPLHIVTHSLGGLVARAMIATARPARLGRVVMLAPPNRGSELADTIARLHLAPVALGALSSILGTARHEADRRFLGPVDYELGVIAGAVPPLVPETILPRPNDGKVAVKATLLPGMADFIVLPVPHSMLPTNRVAIGEVAHFLATGRFDHRRAARRRASPRPDPG